MPPLRHYSKGGWFSGADSACASVFFFPLHTDSLKLSFVLHLKVTGRPLTPRPPWDLSIHTCKDAQGKHDQEGLTITYYDTCTFNTYSLHSIFYFYSDNSLHTRLLTRSMVRET